MSNHMTRTWDHRGSKHLDPKLFTTEAPPRWLYFLFFVYIRDGVLILVQILFLLNCLYRYNHFILYITVKHNTLFVFFSILFPMFFYPGKVTKRYLYTKKERESQSKNLKREKMLKWPSNYKNIDDCINRFIFLKRVK